MTKKKRPHTDTTVPHIPANAFEIMEALLKTPPPPVGDKSTRKGRMQDAQKRAVKRAKRKRR